MSKAFKRNQRRANVKKKCKQVCQMSSQSDSWQKEEDTFNIPVNEDKDDSKKKKDILYDPKKVGVNYLFFLNRKKGSPKNRN